MHERYQELHDPKVMRWLNVPLDIGYVRLLSNLNYYDSLYRFIVNTIEQTRLADGPRKRKRRGSKPRFPQPEPEVQQNSQGR